MYAKSSAQLYLNIAQFLLDGGLLLGIFLLTLLSYHVGTELTIWGKACWVEVAHCVVTTLLR
jgi:hypothetical protein